MFAAIGQIGTTLVALAFVTTALADRPSPTDSLRAHLKLQSHHVQIGEPVWASLAIENTTDEAVNITVPGVKPQIPSPEIGLPLSHVFSGNGGSGIVVTTESGRSWEVPIGYRASSEAAILTLAPHSLVGTSLNLREFFPALRNPGSFRIAWRPYGGQLASNPVVLEVAQLKRAEIVTDFGTMTIHFFYQDAPGHVANFIDLAKGGFYSGLTFHKVEPGYMVMSGCPRGDGTGIRPDGKRIPAEFNSQPHKKGTVSMAHLDDDPDSASCQFFICNTRQKDWDGCYTVFGELVGDESLETLERLMALEIDESGQPRVPVYMRTVRIVNAPNQPMMPLR